MFQFGGPWSFVSGAKPPKDPVATGLTPLLLTISRGNADVKINECFNTWFKFQKSIVLKFSRRFLFPKPV